MVISTGTTVPRWFSVAALYCLQNSIVCTPWGPSAVPTGGAGVAPPAGSWILTTARTRFSGGVGSVSLPRSAGLQLCDLAEFKLDRGLPTEDVDQNLELELVFVDLCDLAGEVRERTFLDPDRLPHLVLEARTAPLGRRLGSFDLDLQDALDLATRQRRGLGTRTHAPGDP